MSESIDTTPKYACLVARMDSNAERPAIASDLLRAAADMIDKAYADMGGFAFRPFLVRDITVDTYQGIVTVWIEMQGQA